MKAHRRRRSRALKLSADEAHNEISCRVTICFVRRRVFVAGENASWSWRANNGLIIQAECLSRQLNRKGAVQRMYSKCVCVAQYYENLY